MDPKRKRYAGLACGAISIGVVGALLLGPSPVTPGAAPETDPPPDSIVGKKFEDVATAELTGASGKVETPEFVPRQVLIGFEAGATKAQQAAALASVDGEIKQRLPMPGVVLVRLNGSLGVDAAQQKIDELAGVRYAEPNVIYRLADTTPTDPYYPYLWGMENTGQEVLSVKGTPDADIDAGAAWDVTKGSSSVVAAVVDTGVDFEHDDLAQQIWTNPRDPKNGVDDDRNGYVDDTNGWDFINNDARPDDDHYHGTHVAGTIAARTDDGKGVVGVAPNTTVMPIKVLSSSGSGSNSGVAAGFDYAGRMGVRVVNASLGCSGSGCFTQTMLDVIKAHPNTLYVIAAGNAASDNEVNPHYPCSYDAANIICVAATDSNDRLASFSNYGTTRVDLAAPGVKVLSDIPGLETAPDRKVIFYEDFEEPLVGNWVRQGTAGTWQVTDEKSFSGSGSLTDRPYERYRRGDASTIFTPPIALKGEVGCSWGMDAIRDIPLGDEAVSGRFGFATTLNGGMNFTQSFSGGNSGVLRWNSREGQVGLPAAYSDSNDARIGINFSSGTSSNGRGIFADNMIVTCADTSPRPVPPSRYGYLNGTSMATPHVTGVVALVAARYPSMSASEIKQQVLGTVDPLTSLAGLTVTGGRVNAARAVGAPLQGPASPAARAKSSRKALPVEPRPVETSLYGSRAAKLMKRTKRATRPRPHRATRGEQRPKIATTVDGPTATSVESTGASDPFLADEIPHESQGATMPAWSDDIYRLTAAEKANHTSNAGSLPFINGQWALDNIGQLNGKPDADIDAPEAWEITKGSPEVTVAILSTGMGFRLPGLVGRNFTNPAEMGDGRETNGVDDDRNGYVDDWRGGGPSDVLNSDAVLDARGAPFDSNIEDNQGEGTILASSVVADPGQGSGIRGVSPGVKVLPIRTKSPSGGIPPYGSQTGNMAMYRGINYAGRVGADVVVLPDDTNVMGSPTFSTLISTYPNTLFVATNSDTGLLPACRSGLPNLLCVGGSSNTDTPGPYLNTSGIDIAVPGVNLVAEGQQWEYRIAEDFEGSVKPYSHDGPENAWQVQDGIGLNGSRGLAVVADRDLPRGTTTHALWSGNLDVPGDLSACGISAWLTRGPAENHTLGIKAGGWDWGFRYYTSNNSTFGNYRQLTSMVAGYMMDMTPEQQRSMSLFSSAEPNSWTAREAFDNIGYVCPKAEPAGSEIVAVDRPLGHKHVEGAYAAGVAALVKSAHPGYGPIELKKAILDGADRVSTLAGFVPEGRRLNARGALDAAAAAPPVAAPPKARVLNVPVPATNNRRPTLRFQAFRADSVDCSVDTGATPEWTPCGETGGEYALPADLTDGTWTFRVKAANADGTTTDSRTFIVDTVSPAAPVFTGGPVGLTNIVGPTSYFVSGESTAKFQCRFEPSGDWQDCTYSLPGKGRFERPGGLADGDYTIRFTQTDLAGNKSPESSRSFTLDTVAPAPLTITGAPASLIRVNTATFGWTRPEPSSAIGVSIDGGIRNPYYTSADGLTFRNLSEGLHTFAFYMRDLAGNYSQPVTRTFTVDTVAPGAPTLVSPPAVTGANAQIDFTGEEGAIFECAIDSLAFSPCTSPWRGSSLTSGTHSLRIRQTDRAGNLGTAIALHSWTADVTPPPTPSISSAPAGTVASREARLDFSGETNTTFLCSFDEEEFAPCTAPILRSGLRDGLRQVRVKQRDTAGNESPIASRTWTVDTTPPDDPIFNMGPSGWSGSTSTTVEFSGRGDGDFLCSLDDGSFASCSSPRSLSSLTDGRHTLRVKRRDTAGNESGIAALTWAVDTVAPTAPSISSGPSGVVASKSASFALSGEANASFECRIDSDSWASCATPKSYASLAEGTHTFEVRQSDQAGNTSPVASRTWTVDTVAPSAPSIASGPSGPSASDTASFSFSGEASASFQCRIDDGAWSGCSSSSSYSALAEGPHTFEVRQSDQAGNTSPVASRTWTVDTVAPTAPSISSGPSGVVASSSASFALSGEANASFECRIDSDSWASCATPKSFASLAEGNHIFEVRQSDQAGNTSPVASRTWTVDTVAPSPPEIQSAPGALDSTSAATIEFTGEGDATFECAVDGSGFTQCESPAVYSSLSDGEHRFEVRQRDRAGNQSASATRDWTVDTSAPEPPEINTRPASRTSETTATFEFVGESGSTLVCSVDAASPVPCSSPLDVTGLTDGAHTFEVSQIDSAGHASPAARYGWEIDTAAPDKPILGDKPASVTTQTSAEFGFSGEDGATFECRLDSSGAYEPCKSPVRYGSLSDGTHDFGVRQIDATGHVSAATAHSWTVDTVAPAAPVLSAGPSGLVNASSATMTFSGEASGWFECRLDSSGWERCESGRSYASLADGEHTFGLRQTDEAGNTSSETLRTWAIDTVVPPAPAINSGPSGLTNSASAAFGFSGEASAAFQCRIDGGSWSACTAPKSYTSLGQGSHTFRARQTDQAGNTSAEATRSWTVDSVAPVLTKMTLSRRSPCCSFVLTTVESGSGLSMIEFSTAKTKPAAGSAPKTTYPLNSPTISVRLTAIPTFARIRDAAGNWSGWVAVTN